MYKFDKQTLEFIKINWFHYLWKGVFTILMTILIAIMLVPAVNYKMIDNEAKVIVAKQNEFSQEKLIKLISDLHFPFPYIVMAQAMHETSLFTSPLFKENKNLFGMKPAAVRITTSVTNAGDYAYYNEWMDSVYDRALYSATYLSSIKTEEEYYSYLGQYYAEDPRYVEKIRRIVIDKQLKSKFK